RVRHAGQLHEDAVQALALYDRLGHAELVDAVTQCQRVLLDCEILPLADRGLREAHAKAPAVAARERRDLEAARGLTELEQRIAAIQVADDLLGAREIGLVGDSDLERVPRDLDARRADVGLPQLP